MTPRTATPGAWRSHWRPAPAVVRVDDRLVGAIAVSPFAAGFCWAALSIGGYVLALGGTDLGSGPLAWTAIGLWTFGAVAGLVDRRRLVRIIPAPSALWAFATPIAYLAARKRRIDAAGLDDSWVPLGVFVLGLVTVAFAWLLWSGLRGLVGG